MVTIWRDAGGYGNTHFFKMLSLQPTITGFQGTHLAIAEMIYDNTTTTDLPGLATKYCEHSITQPLTNTGSSDRLTTMFNQL